MSALPPPPASVVDPRSGLPNFGSFEGGIPPVDLDPLGKSKLFRVAHEKRWVYFAIVTDELLIAVAIVRLGYLANHFAFVFDKTRNAVVLDRSALAPAFAAQVGDTGGEGCSARFSWLGRTASFERARGSSIYEATIRAPGFELDASLDASPSPPRVGLIAALPGGLLDATEKGVLLEARGEARVLGRRVSLDGARAGFDFTYGWLARHTIWRWAFAIGKTSDGRDFALNLVQPGPLQGECAIWIGGKLLPLAAPRFEFDPRRTLEPWVLRTDDPSIDLVVAPGGQHAEIIDLGVARSKFVQPVGLFRGTIRAGGEVITIPGALGVVEDQDVIW